MTNKRRSTWLAWAVAFWAWLVLAAYYANAWPYYQEKISTFGRFLLRLS